MTRRALVRETSNGKALVCPLDTGECSSCEARHACLSLTGKNREDISFWTDNEVGAEKGDVVKLELSSGASLTIITVTFLVPVLMLLAGYLVMSAGSDPQRALGAGIGLLSGIAVAVAVNRRMGAKRNFNMRIVRILERSDGQTAAKVDPESHMEG